MSEKRDNDMSTPPLSQRGRYGGLVANLLTLSDFAVIAIVYGIILWANPEMLHRHPRLVGLLVTLAYAPSAWYLREIRSSRAIQMDHILFNAFRAVGMHALFFSTMLFFLDIDYVPGRVYAEFYGGIIVALPLWWVVSRLVLKAYRRWGRNFSRVAIVGTGPTACRLYEAMTSDAGFGYRVFGFVGDNPGPDFPYKKLYSGPLSGLENFVRRNDIDQIYYTLSGEDDSAIGESIRVADHNMAQFFLVPQLSRYVTRSFAIRPIGEVPVLSTRNNPLTSAVNRSIKRVCDIAISSVVLIASPVVLIPVTIAIKLSSPGPIFFKQRRTGYMGKEFTCWKFRTMRVNDSADSAQATKDDPRKTRVGNFLRRSSIDELPQFWNVLRGDMSVVGPRPHMLVQTREYSKLIDKYMVRHLIKPGITGWAQVNGYRGQTEQLWQMERRVKYDVWYIENWSFLLDVKIIFRTVINALHGEENAF